MNGNFDSTLKALIQVATAAGVFDTPEFQKALNHLILTQDIHEAQALIDQIRPIAIDRILKGPQPFEEPNPDEISGMFPIGKAPIGKNGFVFGLNPHELSMHVFITGSTGTGKSVVVQNITEGLRAYNRGDIEGIHYWIIDFMAEYRHVLRMLDQGDELLVLRPKDFRFNPLQPPPGVDPNRWLSITCDTFASTVGVFFGAKDLLNEFIDKLYNEFGVYENSGNYPTISNLFGLALHYHQYGKFGYRKRDSLETLIGRLRTIHRDMSPTILCRQGHDLLELLKKDIVLELHGLTNYVQNFFVNLLLQWVYNYKKSNNIRGTIPNHVVIFDEAKRVFDASYEQRPLEPIPIIVGLVDEIRQFRTGLIVSDQEPTKILKSLKANTYTKIILQIREGSDIKDQAESIGLTNEQRDAIGVLPPWTAIVKKGPIKPFLCQILHHEPERKDVSDYELDIVMQPLIAGLNWKELTLDDLRNDVQKYNDILEKDKDSFDRAGFERLFESERPLPAEEAPPPVSGEPNAIVQELEQQAETIVQEQEKSPKEEPKKEELSDEERGFLQHIVDEPFFFKTARYKASGVHPNKGNELYKSLEQKGLIKPVNIKQRKGRKPAVYYGATEKAFETLDLALPIELADPTYGGFEHRFWVSEVYKNLEKRGLEPIQEYSKGGRRADIGCRKDGELFAIEIGTSDARNEIRNIKGDLKEGFDKVWVICTEKIHKDLSRRMKTELDPEARSKVKIDLTYDFYDGKVKFPEKRKVLFISDGIPKTTVTEALRGRFADITLKALSADKVKEEHVEWADEIVTMNGAQKEKLLENFPETKITSLHLPKEEALEGLEKLLTTKLGILLI